MIGIGDRTSADRPLTISLQTIVFAMFVCACIARWLAHFGPGLAVILGWAIVVGAIVGAIIGTCALAVKILASGLSSVEADICLRELGSCVLVSSVAGLLAGSLGFAAATVGTIERISVQGIWIVSIVERGARAIDASMGIAIFVLSFAFLGSFVSALAYSLRLMAQKSRVHYMYRVASLVGGTAIVTGVAFATTLCIVTLGVDNKHGHSPGFESMSGLLPLAIVLWFALGAILGGAMASATAFLSLCGSYTQKSRIGKLGFGLLSVSLILLVTEAALRGWVRSIVAAISAI